MTYDFALQKCILGAFQHEANTILHVENWLMHNGFRLSRVEIRQMLSDLLRQGAIKIIDSPDNVTFENSDDLLLEDFWFDITESGRDQFGYSDQSWRKFLQD
ncbi:hypothetical protein [Alicyclobacillus ferrooxydans]|uniref:Uncharacterized protein n=1 Tax=Alicyclobacillus ferrooxydans TaxID=471514 RepID=A0A0N8PMK0_9BACL|nr:hypothetical protein [Alicyclobacillus ferrooxydans]KPV38941.1 hypothetical protein AN477_23140 [Alicyclobacillus ferrooxydans]